jgi:hypothetical protein
LALDAEIADDRAQLCLGSRGRRLAAVKDERTIFILRELIRRGWLRGSIARSIGMWGGALCEDAPDLGFDQRSRLADLYDRVTKDNPTE